MKRIIFLFLALLAFHQAALAVQSLCGEHPAVAYREIHFMGGRGFMVEVTAPANCTYDISTSQGSSIILTSPGAATGNSTISYDVPQNNSLAFPRVGVIIVGNKTITINWGPFLKEINS